MTALIPKPSLRAEILQPLPWLGLLSRLVFTSTLLLYFWSSALTKIDGLRLSMNGYAQILPAQMAQVGYDVSALGPVSHLIVFAGTAAEFILPLMIAIGLVARLSAIAMIFFIAVMSYTDIIGHAIGAQTAGMFFDRFPDGVIADQRLFWLWLLVVLAISGGGWLSLDRAMLRLRGQ